MTADVVNVEALQAEVLQLSRLVEQVAEANAHAAELMVELEETRAELQAKNEELERKVAAVQRAEAASAAQSRFLANVSHELRTPMNGVLGMCALLWETELSEHQRSLLGAARGSAESLLVVLNDLLDLSKIQAGHMELERVPFDLVALVEDLCAACAPQAFGKGVELVVTMDAEPARVVLGDPTRVRQILQNLIGNAIKFTSEGFVRVLVSAGAGPDQVCFRVEDTGIGIPEEAQARLFDPFTQADGSTTRRFGGTGLGLAICRELAEGLGGHIEVSSIVGRGATFEVTVTLPSVDIGAPDSPQLFPVVLVEPDPVVVDSLRRGGRRWGVDVDAYQSFDRAIAALSEKDYAAVLVDESYACAAAKTARALAERACELGIRFYRLAQPGAPPCEGVVADPPPDGVRVLRKPLAWTRLVVGESQDSPAHESAFRPLPSRTKPWRVLIAEDNAVNQRVLEQMLRNMDCEVTVVGTGAEAIRALESGTNDLLLMDCHMPDVDGYEATRRIRAREDSICATPIVAVTASAMASDRHACEQAGMDDYITKPIDVQRLRDVLVRWLGARSRCGPAAPSPGTGSGPSRS